MAWTAPITWSANTVLTAAQLNIHLRDNLNEMAPSKISAANHYIVSTGRHTIAQRKPQVRYHVETVTTKSQEYTDTERFGPEVTTRVAAGALVMISAQMANSVAGGFSIIGFRVSTPPEDEEDAEGTEIHAPTDERSLLFESQSANQDRSSGYTTFIGVPEPANYTFTLKYRVTAGTGTFLQRYLIVLPF